VTIQLAFAKIVRARYTSALVASVLVHVSVFAAFLVLTIRHNVTEGQSVSENMTTVAVVEVPLESTPLQFARQEDLGVDDPTLDVAGFSFDVDKIARRRRLLFPLITDDVALEALTRASEENARRPLQNPLTRHSAGNRLPALSLSAEEVQHVVDRAWSRSERWKAFSEIAALTAQHDGNDDTLALILRKYVDENLLQPFDDVSEPDPRVWVELTLAADFVDFLDFIATYVRQYSGTRTATELLFLLDKLIRANHDALVTLMRKIPETDLRFTRTANPGAFELVSAIRTYYEQSLTAEGLISADAVAQRHDSVRLMVLSTILATSPDGYRADDARFLAGEIHWKAQRPDEAVRLWREMSPGPEDAYHLPARRVQEAIVTRPANALRIRQALRDQEGRWWVASVDRLRQFGYRPNRY
jgi:hypothetical protein